MTAAVLRALALAALLVVRARCSSTNGVDGYYGGGTTGGGGGVRFARLDKFMHDRMGLGGDDRPGELPALSTDRGLLSRTTVASVTTRRPEDEDGEDDDVDDEAEDDEGYVDDESIRRRAVRLRHGNRREQDNDLYDKDVQNYEPMRTMSPISESKWRSLGSRKSVEETFKGYKGFHVPQGGKESDEFIKHRARVSKEALCKIPRSRVVKVSDHYPSSNKKYIPSCTVLHQCADDTGCCNSPTLKCGPKTTQQILLHFLVYTAPELSDSQSPSQSYQTLSFYNHTECQCQSNIEDYSMPKDSSLTTSMEAINQQVMHRVSNNKHYIDSMDIPIKSASMFDSCKCPTEYTVRYLANGSCSCDCFDKQHECIRYKKGNIYFNFIDKYCITSGQCLMPMCEYGLYSHRTGRCPKKYETLYSLKRKHYF